MFVKHWHKFLLNDENRFRQAECRTSTSRQAMLLSPSIQCEQYRGWRVPRYCKGYGGLPIRLEGTLAARRRPRSSALLREASRVCPHTEMQAPTREVNRFLDLPSTIILPAYPSRTLFLNELSTNGTTCSALFSRRGHCFTRSATDHEPWRAVAVSNFSYPQISPAAPLRNVCKYARGRALAHRRHVRRCAVGRDARRQCGGSRAAIELSL